MKEDERDNPKAILDEKGIEALTDKELVMLLVQTGSRYKSLEDISREVLSLIDRKKVLSKEDLMMIPGLGDVKASVIAAALELGRRRNVRKARKIITPEDVYQEVRHYASREQENLIVLALNGAHEILFTEVTTVGLVNMALCHPRELFAKAIQHRATAIILVHNHPSGNHEEASPEDIAITKRIRQAGQILGINLIDHVIISEYGFMSFKAKGML